VKAETTEQEFFEPTEEQKIKGHLVKGGRVKGQVHAWYCRHALLIDMLLEDGWIDEMQHCYGVQFHVIDAISRERVSVPLEDLATANGSGFMEREMSREKAEKLLIRKYLSKEDWKIIEAVCCEQVHPSVSGTSNRSVRLAFEALGDALCHARKVMDEEGA
jgi:hypothetical protein